MIKEGKKGKKFTKNKQKRKYAKKGVRCILAMAVSSNAGNQR